MVGRSYDESEVLTLDEPTFALSCLALAFRACLLLVWHQDKSIAEGSHGSILALKESDVAADLHQEAHVVLEVLGLRFVGALGVQRGHARVHNVGIQRLDFEVGERHLVLVNSLELLWVGELLAVVGDGGECPAGREDRLWYVVTRNGCSSIVQSIVVGLREIFGRC